MSSWMSFLLRATQECLEAKDLIYGLWNGFQVCLQYLSNFIRYFELKLPSITFLKKMEITLYS